MKKIYIDIKVITADDHPLYLSGLNAILENTDGIELVATCTDGVELLQAYHLHKPDILLTDIKMPRMDGIDAVIEIRKEDKEIGIICLSGYDDKQLITEMLEAEANAYVLKNADPTDIIKAIVKVYNKERYISRRAIDSVSKIPNFNPFKKIEKPHLSPKEIEVIQLLCKRLQAKEIAKLMNISHRTVEQHKSNIQEKLNVNSTLAIVMYAIKHRLVKLEDNDT